LCDNKIAILIKSTFTKAEVQPQLRSILLTKIIPYRTKGQTHVSIQT